MELDENVQPASSRRSYTLSKDVLPPLETLVVTIVGSTELDGILSVAIPNRLLEDWANSRSTDTSFVALLNERIEDDIMSFDPDATRLETQLYRRSLSVTSKLRKTRGAKRIDVLFGSTITTIYKGQPSTVHCFLLEGIPEEKVWCVVEKSPEEEAWCVVEESPEEEACGVVEENSEEEACGVVEESPEEEAWCVMEESPEEESAAAKAAVDLRAAAVNVQKAAMGMRSAAVNVIMEKEVAVVPVPVATFLAGGRLIALNKGKEGNPPDVRPIAVGETLRRLTGKCICAILRDKISSFFQPSQFGVACKAGAEKIVHSLRRCIEENWLSGDFVVFKVDMSNAFKMVSRQAVMDQCATYFLELLPWVSWCCGSHTSLWHPMGQISSQTGVQQGDPLGPMLFALVLHKLVTSIDVDDDCLQLLLEAWYLDDGVLAGERSAVIRALHLIEDLGPHLGLYINFSKCKLFSRSVGNCGPYLEVGRNGLECNSSVLNITADVSLNGMVVECRDLSTGYPGTLIGNTTINIVTVAWRPSTTGGVPTSYNVSFNDDPNTLVPIPSGMLQHTFTGLSNVVIYNISVVAINCFGYNVTSLTVKTPVTIIGIVVAIIAILVAIVVVAFVTLKCLAPHQGLQMIMVHPTPPRQSPSLLEMNRLNRSTLGNDNLPEGGSKCDKYGVVQLTGIQDTKDKENPSNVSKSGRTEPDCGTTDSDDDANDAVGDGSNCSRDINAGDYEGHECVPTLTPEEEKCWLVAAMSVYQHLQLVVAIPLSAKRLNSKYSSRVVMVEDSSAPPDEQIESRPSSVSSFTPRDEEEQSRSTSVPPSEASASQKSTTTSECTPQRQRGHKTQEVECASQQSKKPCRRVDECDKLLVQSLKEISDRAMQRQVQKDDMDASFCQEVAGRLKRLSPKDNALAKMKIQKFLFDIEFPAQKSVHDRATEMLVQWLQLEETSSIEVEDEGEHADELEGHQEIVDKLSC
ncbi:hypothetical protein EMCRGX_G033624 [Ephydatia muelleri]